MRWWTWQGLDFNTFDVTLVAFQYPVKRSNIKAIRWLWGQREITSERSQYSCFSAEIQGLKIVQLKPIRVRLWGGFIQLANWELGLLYDLKVDNLQDDPEQLCGGCCKCQHVIRVKIVNNKMSSENNSFTHICYNTYISIHYFLTTKFHICT